MECKHDWQAPYHLVGGERESPGVAGKYSVRVCGLCASWAHTTLPDDPIINGPTPESAAWLEQANPKQAEIWKDARIEDLRTERDDLREQLAEAKSASALAVESQPQIKGARK